MRPRQVGLYCATQLTSHSLPFIGKHFGDRDHTTVMHARNKIGALVVDDKLLCSDIATIKARLQKLAVEEDPELKEINKIRDQLMREIEKLEGAKARKNSSLEKTQIKLELLFEDLGKFQKQVKFLRAEVKYHEQVRASIKGDNDRVAMVANAFTSYEQSKFTAQENGALKDLLSACSGLRTATQKLPTIKGN